LFIYTYYNFFIENLEIVSTTTLPTPSNKKTPAKEIDFVDFFSSIEQEHTVIFGNQNYQNTVTNSNSLRYSTSTNPFLAMQSQRKQIPMQQDILNQQTFQPTSTIKDTNPFRSSIYVQDPAPISQSVVPYQNPFLQPSPPAINVLNPFNSMNSEAQFQPHLSQQTIQSSFTTFTTSTTSTTSTIDNNPFRRFSVSPGFVTQQTQLTAYPQSIHSQDSSTSSFQSSDSSFSQNQFSSYSMGNNVSNF